jgi:predicted N-acetyltransferase YhbS
MSQQLRGYQIDILRPDEIENLLDLQRANLAANLDAQTIESQGFVSFVYSPEDIRKKMEAAPQIIARDGDLIIGYALVTTMEVGWTIPNFVPFLEKFSFLKYKDKTLDQLRTYAMGQVCVRAGYRGLGIFDALYAEHKRRFKGIFDLCVTEIATDNGRSLAAHKRVGFETVHTFFDDFNKKEWQIVVLDI